MFVGEDLGPVACRAREAWEGHACALRKPQRQGQASDPAGEQPGLTTQIPAGYKQHGKVIYKMTAANQCLK